MTQTNGMTLAALAALALLPLGAARADGGTYVMSGPGGDLLGNAFFAAGTIGSPLTEIDGAFATTSATSTSGVPDLFAFDLTGDEPFSASTLYSMGTAPDTQLFLFNSAGDGVLENFIDGSQIQPGGFLLGEGATIPSVSLPAGLYYLGIAPEGAEPQSAGGDIFPNPLADGVPEAGVYGPTGVGGSGPLTKWSITSDDVDSGSYTIALTGAAYAVPEPAPVALFVLGLPALALAVRRRASARKTSDVTPERTHA